MRVSLPESLSYSIRLAPPRGGDIVLGMVEDHVVLVSMPKSASVFVRAAIEMSSGLERHSFGPVPLVQQIDVEVFGRFLSARSAQAGQHLAPSNFNLALLRNAGIDQITFLHRDPLDALCSWRHHLERTDVQSWNWHTPMLMAAGLLPPGYYDLSWDAKADALLELYLPKLVEWRDRWMAVEGFRLQSLRYEDFVVDEAGAIAEILGFHAIQYDFIRLPEKNAGTHYRKGVVRSHEAELSDEQIARTI